MAIGADEYKSTVGLRDLYVAEVTADSADAYTAGSNAILAPAVAASHKAKTSTKTQYADDGAYDVFNTEGETELELEVTGIPLETLASILGKYYDSTTGTMSDHGGTPPYFALSFRTIKSNGSYRYYQYLKGRFTSPDEEQATLSDSPDPKTIKLKYTAIKTVYEWTFGAITDGIKRLIGDEDLENFDGSTWFNAVVTPTTLSA